jgi:hypothetical protein
MLGKFMQLNLTSIISRLTLEQDDKLSAVLSIAATENKKPGDLWAVRFKLAVRDGWCPVQNRGLAGIL